MTNHANRSENRLKAVLGPTNTGKTHYAVERMMGHSSGMIGFPLRLLAREVYDKVVAVKGASRVALVTGEEKIIPETAKYFLCTVESMPVKRPVEFLAVDEVQLAAEPQRGHIFTQRILGARGMSETLLLGSNTIRPVLKRLFPEIEIISRPRFSTLGYSAPKKLSKLPRRTALVAFRAEDVYALAELLRRQRGGTAIIMGALSPRTRNAQAELYQSGEVDYMVATDAIGMGLNLDIDHVVLAATTKFDGEKVRLLRADEVAQIAGRAGRHMNNGTFTTLADSGEPLDDRTIERVCEHHFDPLKAVKWRNASLDFSSTRALVNSLTLPSGVEGLIRAPRALDLRILEKLSGDDLGLRDLRDSAAVSILWAACQIPDFERLSFSRHAGLVGTVFGHLSSPAQVIPHDWIAKQISHLDNVQGDIESLGARIAATRIWTYISHQNGWLRDPEHWSAATRAVEDKLSDALHERLTQRFVDRRTAVLMREMRQKGQLAVSIDKDGAVEVEGHFLGRLEGFTFQPDTATTHDDHKTLKSAAERALRDEIALRVRQMIAGEPGEITLECADGVLNPLILWRGNGVASLVPGRTALTPRIKLLVNSLLSDSDGALVLAHLQAWLSALIDDVLGPLTSLIGELDGVIPPEEGAAPLGGLARGIAFQVAEYLGVLPRDIVDKDIRTVDQDARKGLRRFRIRIGASTIFIPILLKPAPTRLRIILWALHEEKERLPALPTPGMVWVEMARRSPKAFYRLAGFHPAGTKAVRVDMVERLADAVRPLGQNGKAFEVTPEIMGLVGLSGEDFAHVMRVIGYKWSKRMVIPQAPEVPPTTTGPAPTAEQSENQGPPAAEKTEDLKDTDKETSTETGENPVKEAVERYFFVWQSPVNQAKWRDGKGQTHQGKAQNKSPKDNAKRPKGKGNRPKGKGDAPKGELVQPKKAGATRPKKARRPQVKNQPAVDHNSPFAILKDLKTSMQKKAKG
jgi:ATP-dependent RNA helicase SUPV3L1/SUV3